MQVSHLITYDMMTDGANLFKFKSQKCDIFKMPHIGNLNLYSKNLTQLKSPAKTSNVVQFSCFGQM